MASIGLYDIDFNHSSKFSINLELMKVFNYYYSKGNIVRLINKGENMDKYNKIIFFKQNPSCAIPKGLDFCGDKKIIHGYGFFNSFTPLKEEIAETPPDFMIYDVNSNRIKDIALYNKIKNNSLIRIENNDFTYFNEKATNIFIVDYNFLNLSQSESFLKEHKKYSINFLWPLIAKNEQSIQIFFQYVYNSNRRLIIDFKFTYDFFMKYYYEPIVFQMKETTYDKNTQSFFKRFIKMILISKNENKPINLHLINPTLIQKKDNKLYNIYSLIGKWGLNKTQESFYDFIKDNKKDYDNVENTLANNTEIRLLLKQNPKNYNIQNIDFWN